MESGIQAHNIALKTLKQRCEYLQQRLTVVEEENCKLKLGKLGESNSNILQNSSSLEKQIMLLNQQKSQLAKQVQMITAENQTLWSQLSELLPENDNFGFKLSVSQDLTIKQPANSLLNSTNDFLSDCGKESLQEISLKLINDILMGKIELENQYSQMIDLQKDSNLLDEKNISFLSTKFDNRSTLNNINVYVQKLKDFKQTLHQQKKELSNAITNMKNLKHIPSANKSLNGDEATRHTSMKGHLNKESNLEECGESNLNFLEGGAVNSEGTAKMVCPMCGQSFTGQFADFYQHVCEHFEDENDVYEDASTTFEVVP